MPAALGALESAMRRLQSTATCVSATSRAVRAAAIVPIFGLYWTAVRMRAKSRGPVIVRSHSIENLLFDCKLPDLVQTYINLFGLWEPDLTHFIRRRLREGDTFVDVGANIGYYTVLASKLVGPRGCVVSIEASPRVFQDLRATVELNHAGGNTRLINMAASDHVGELEVFAGPAHNIGLTTTVAGRGFQSQARIACAPLATLMTHEEARSARLVKIDVEGGEPAVLEGMKLFLDMCRDDVEILVELSPSWWANPSRTASQVLQPFMDRGFHPFALPNSYWPWRYLWPNDVTPPGRISIQKLDSARRLDLVLSRQDTDVL